MSTKTLTRAVAWLLTGAVFLLPLIFLPFFTDAYDFGKGVFLLGAIFLACILWAVQIVAEKKLVYKKSRYFLPAFLLVAAFIASTYLNSTNRSQSWTVANGVGSLVIVFLAYFILVNLAKRKMILYGLLAGGAVLSLIRLALFLGGFTFPINLPALNLAITAAWSPAGSLVAQAIFLLVLIPIGFALIYEAIKQQELPQAAGLFLVNTFNLAGLGVSFYLLNTVAKPILLPQATAWAIALEGLKEGRFALFGLGPGQFVNAFTAFKALSFNASQYWDLRFGTSSNWYYQLLTEVGLVGLAVYLLLVWKVVKDSLKVFRQPRISPVGLGIHLGLVILLAMQFFFPFTFFLTALLFILLAVAREEESATFDFANLGNAALIYLLFPVAFWGALVFFTAKYSLANHYFLSSLKAAVNNDGLATYNLQIKAISTDPAAAAYRIAYSQTNFALASNLAANPPAGGLTDADRTTITQLIQQAIREAKAAAAIDPRNVSAWENLAVLYRNLVNFAEGADQWAVGAYEQAIALDPLNPRLRVDLGGLYYGAKNWAQAANFFAQAANLKPDWANTHYNLANTLREAGDFQNAKKEYEVALTLVPLDSSDYQKVSLELDEVKKRLPTPTPVPQAQRPVGETLSTPQLPTGGINPPISLPENEGPEIANP